MRATTNPPRPSLSRAWLATNLPLLGVGLLASLLVWPALAHAVEVWSTDGERPAPCYP